MSKTGRQIILGIIVVISICAIPLMLLYGSGYSINWRQRAIHSTSGFTVVTIPKQALVTVDPLGLERTTPAFISSLEPGWYDLRIERPGYLSAQYSVRLQPRRTIQFDPVMLWPSHPSVKSIDKYPEKTLQPDSHTITFNNESTQLLWNHSKNKALLHQPHSLSLYESNTKKIVNLLRQESLISEAKWYTQDWYIFYISANAVHALDTRVSYGHNDAILYQGENLHDLQLSPNGQELYFTSGDIIYELKLR